MIMCMYIYIHTCILYSICIYIYISIILYIYIFETILGLWFIIEKNPPILLDLHGGLKSSWFFLWFSYGFWALKRGTIPITPRPCFTPRHNGAHLGNIVQQEGHQEQDVPPFPTLYAVASMCWLDSRNDWLDMKEAPQESTLVSCKHPTIIVLSSSFFWPGCPCGNLTTSLGNDLYI
jgi:hypothetical protein